MIAGPSRKLMSLSLRAMLRGVAMLAASVALLAYASMVTAEEAVRPSPDGGQEQTQTVAPPPQVVPRPIPTPPEVVDAIGRFIGESISNVGAGVKGAGDTIGGATSAAGDVAKGIGDAAGTVAKLGSNVAAGWERCIVAPNGAPDCSGASLLLCRAKGFAQGSSLDITSARKCPMQMYREGRAPNDRECVDESFVSRAVCQ